MRVKCIKNRGAALPKDCLDPISGFDEKTRFALIIGKEYIVYGFTLYLGYVWYYLCDENYTYYPFWNPAPLFEVVDNRLSRFWRYNHITGSNHEKTNVIVAFKEWVNDPFYYDKLTNGEESAIAQFKHYKELMDLEFPIMAIASNPIPIENDWLMCPDCNETWQVSSSSGMLKCPRCSRLLLNPFWTQNE